MNSLYLLLCAGLLHANVSKDFLRVSFFVFSTWLCMSLSGNMKIPLFLFFDLNILISNHCSAPTDLSGPAPWRSAESICAISSSNIFGFQYLCCTSFVVAVLQGLAIL
ncbi:uncharacterized protein B0I36DRAFT_159160 [Microdochium trichocladiopsis]|uniref:Uncharacterized protein n=1 Tax=Microdochium trichocladiopsis TaxID=1682393 RepID=A0A9P9BMP8_9PEZI|nr:uncharacterized protein B0I36DRAFT_159160 [Microdochium trichocladiopsis]KAH7026488.1 hypothetical protein B0I36DRAFT_159160 [Microdochium trichocladiopsis]